MTLFKNAPISVKLLIIMIFSGIPIFCVLSYFVDNQYNDKRSVAELKVQSAVQAIASEHNAQVEGTRSLLIALSQYPDIRHMDAVGCSKILNLILEKSPSGLNIGIADNKGHVIATGIKQPLPIKYSIEDRKYFKDAIRTRKFSVGEYAVSRVANKPTLHFAQPVLDAQGHIILLLYAALDLSSFSKVFDAQDFPKGSIINLTDHAGIVLFRYSKVGLDNQTGKPDHADLRSHITGPMEEGMFSGTGLDGAIRHFAFKRLRLSPTDPPYLYIRVSIPEEAATATASKAFLLSIMVLSFAAFSTYVLTKITAGRYIVHPLEQLVKAAKQVERGDLDAKSNLPYTIDEIGQLAKSFDDMTISLSERLKEISQAESEKHQLAYYDVLTGLPNRRLLQDRLNLALVRSKRLDTGCALLYIDIDDFKLINESLGHTAGDRLLNELATRYKLSLRQDDLIGRMGGDEFAVILHDVQNVNAVTIVVEKLLKATTIPFELDGRQLLASASIGVALYPKDAENGNTLEKYADIALFQAKEEGKNTFRMFSEELNRSSHERISLIHLLQHALERDELELLYQPKVCNKTGNIIGVEALLRWNNAEFGLVMPVKFIPIAEETKLIIPIGEWVLRKACEQQVAWKRLGYDLTMAVNISAVQFKVPNLIQSIKTILEETGINPEQLELELTESCLVDKPDEVIKTLHEIRKLNCRIAIDDFGTGYSSLSYLKDFPVNVLKIDRSFVKDISNSESNQAIAQSVINLAYNLNMVTVAEGVESADQHVILNRMGCNYIQGYLHSRPVPADQILNLVGNASKPS